MDAIVEATLRALRKHGYAATSLQRIADEAGTSKRMVLHYFGTRDRLFDEAVGVLGRRILGQVEEAVAGQEDPGAALSGALDAVWDEILADPGLHAIFFGLIAESVTDPSHRAAIAAVRQEYRELLARVVAASSGGARYEPDRLDLTVNLTLATLAGLTIDYLERGDTDSLRRAFEEFKRRLAAELGASG